MPLKVLVATHQLQGQRQGDDECQALVYQRLSRWGWIAAMGDEAVTKTMESILRMAEPFRVGDVLERRENLQVRVNR